jgi:hypothetical protein
MPLSESDLYPKPLPIAATKQFLSRIPGRTPMDKIHKQVNHAKSAVNNFFNGYDGRDIYYEGGGWMYPRGFDRREDKWEHTGHEMEIYELVDGAWSLLYTIKRGDVELPWKKGQLAANIEKVNRMLEKEERDLTKHIRKLADAAYRETGVNEPTEQFMRIYELGYRAGMEHKK